MLSLQAIFSALAIFLTLTNATSASSAPGFEITQLTSRIHNAANSTKDASLSFLVHDPDPITNTSALCQGSWDLNGTYPSGAYISCSNSSFGWNFESFQNIYTFTLQIKHTYEDKAVSGGAAYPYDEITNFAKAGVSRNQTSCATVHKAAYKGDYVCHQKDSSTIEGTIWATIA